MSTQNAEQVGARTQVRISVHDVGQHYATVRYAASGHAIHMTRDYPYGLGYEAYLDAEAWAEHHGYDVVVS